MRIVGTNHGGYANQRNISDLPFTHYRVVRCRNFYRLPNYAYFRLKGKMHPKWPFLHWDGGFSNCDVLHFFNGISLGKRPWLSTFETYLPRWAAYGAGGIDLGLRKLAGSSCKRLIALSECTKRIQEQFLSDYPSFASEIKGKVNVLHPPQAALVGASQIAAKEAARQANGIIKMVLIGADFFRKGGLETLRALDVVLEKGGPFKLEIVSAMHFGDYASQTTRADLDEAHRIIAKHPNAITLHDALPNARVLDLLRAADIGLLPTWADTYGYAALEAMAAGCPVISTDIRALPEVNSLATGWVIATEKDTWGNGLIGTEVQRQGFSKQLKEDLVAVFEEIAGRPESLLPKSQAALERIRSHHDPHAAAKLLEGWYDQALIKGS